MRQINRSCLTVSSLNPQIFPKLVSVNFLLFFLCGSLPLQTLYCVNQTKLTFNQALISNSNLLLRACKCLLSCWSGVSIGQTIHKIKLLSCGWQIYLEMGKILLLITTQQSVAQKNFTWVWNTESSLGMRTRNQDLIFFSLLFSQPMLYA